MLPISLHVPPCEDHSDALPLPHPLFVIVPYLKIELGALYMPGKHSATKLHPQQNPIFNFYYKAITSQEDCLTVQGKQRVPSAPTESEKGALKITKI